MTETNGDRENLRMLTAGRVDYAAMDLLNGDSIIRRAGLAGKIEPLPSRSVAEHDIGICFAKGRVSLAFIAAFSNALKQFKQSEALQAIRHKFRP